MCGRYTIIAKAEEIEKRFNVEVPEAYIPRYNAAPTQILPVITNERPEGVSLFQWGLIPGWAKDKSIGSKLLNARSETLAEKASFKTALKRRRCLVLSDGFYEWKRTPKKTKIPYHIFLKNKGLFAFAGLWETYREDDQQTLHTFTIITTSANSTISNIHQRMPVILTPEMEQVWLNIDETPYSPEQVLTPYAADEIAFNSISPLVNSVRNDNPQLIVPTPPADQFGNLTLFD